VAALQLLVGIGASMQTLAQAKISLVAAARASAVAEKEIPAGSIVIVDRQLAESLDAIGKWKLVEENFIAAGAGGPGGFGGPGGRGGAAGPGGMFPPMQAGGPGEPAFADNLPSPQQRGKNRAQQERYAGLRPDERRERAWADLTTWADGKPVFWFARSLDAVDNALPTGADYKSVAEIDAPTMMLPGGGGGAGPLPGGAAGGLPGRGGRGGPGRGVRGGGFGPSGGLAPNFPGGRGGSAGALNARLRVVRIEFGKP
jgi:hypothetical protein